MLKATKAGGDKELCFPGASWRSTTLPTPWFRISGLWNRERINFSHHVCGNLLQQWQETHAHASLSHHSFSWSFSSGKKWGDWDKGLLWLKPWGISTLESSVLLGSLKQLNHLLLCSLSGPHILLPHHRTCPGHNRENTQPFIYRWDSGAQRGALTCLRPHSELVTAPEQRQVCPAWQHFHNFSLLLCVSPAAPSTQLGTQRPLGNLPREVIRGDGEQRGLWKHINPGLNPGSVT